MDKKRPVNLALTTMQFPVMALASIGHRLSGLLLFFLIPVILLGFGYSLASEQGFDALHHLMTCVWMRVLVWVLVSALIYHIIAGVRHLLMDAHVGDTKRGGRLGAWLVMIFSFILIVLFALVLFA